MSDKISLEYEKKNCWTYMSDLEKYLTFDFCEGYKSFLDKSKTERESCTEIVRIAEENGFVDLNDCISGKIDYKPGLKVYAKNHEKSVFLAVIGSGSIENGLSLVGSHIDCPRLDLKPSPLYEDHNYAYFKTHYYGGIKKYQWVAIPLALHGVIILNDGTKKTISIGEDESDPVFYISDLLPHLSQEQNQHTAPNIIKGEQLNVMLGSIPITDLEADKTDSCKYGILKLLNEKYGIVEKDFFNAELEIVPAMKARDVGLDRGLVGAYGQDDRVCAYTSLRALCDIDYIPEKTLGCYMSDKEEIGSAGITGARSNWLENMILELCALENPSNGILTLRRALRNTKFLSADVTAAFDPTFPEVSEIRNVSFAGNGIGLAKYTGSGGKYSASDACAELVATITKTFDENCIPWQLTEMGRVDLGGGGTIAQYMADMGVEVLDCGVPVIAMHSPFEVTSKADVYWTYRAYKAFYKI